MPSPEFEAAEKRALALAKRPSNDDLLALYGLYKQATEGNVKGARPGRLSVRARAKYDAWASHRGTSAADAEAQYMALVDRLGG